MAHFALGQFFVEPVCRFQSNHISYISASTVTQGIFSRTPNFDGNWIILTVQDVVKSVKPPGLWLNIQVNALCIAVNSSFLI